ncbi:uncharacterized mitochondrial protein AtMg00860-like [Rutidosis leptorrhynchoides]|uniref:uncharacterized mitochondrial protein AtMg00860-like n=1 Tax=Rutidosis leptorrhynchoides TaxID=125765 RepID=UPI003A9A1DE6
MRQNTLFAKKSKCVFATSKVEYSGHVISAEGVSTDHPTKIKAMANWFMPKTLRQLRSFLGLTGYYMRFITNYAMISRPLNLLTKKDSFLWSDLATIAFNETDASGIGIGANLQQGGHPIAFISKILSQRHQALSTYDRQFLDIMQALEK